MRSLSRSLGLVLGLLSLSAAAARAQLSPPIVAHPLPDLTVAAGAAPSVIMLADTFALAGVNGPVVRLTTALGKIDVALTPDAAPVTVENFLNYVDRGAYIHSFLHRSVANFIVQGGGYTFKHDDVFTIGTDPPVANEFNVSNTRGTLAAATFSNDPDSATSQWFFNEADNGGTSPDGVDFANGGATVFGHIISQSGLDVLDEIAALKIVAAGNVFSQLPVLHRLQGALAARDLVFVKLAVIPLLPTTPGDPALLKLRVTSSNPKLVKATLKGSKLTLRTKEGLTGSATISVQAAGSPGSIADTFNVTVQ